MRRLDSFPHFQTTQPVHRDKSWKTGKELTGGQKIRGFRNQHKYQRGERK